MSFTVEVGAEKKDGSNLTEKGMNQSQKVLPSQMKQKSSDDLAENQKSPKNPQKNSNNLKASQVVYDEEESDDPFSEKKKPKKKGDKFDFSDDEF